MAKKVKASCKNNKDCNKNNCAKTCAEPVVTQTVTVPVTISAPQPSSEAQQLTSDNSPAAIRDQAAHFYELFDRYDKLRVLARRLNGLPQIGPYPTDVNIDKVELSFTVADQKHTAVISGSKIVGELASLIANELNSLIEQMYRVSFSLTHVTSAMQKAIENSVSKRPELTGAFEDNSVFVREEDTKE